MPVLSAKETASMFCNMRNVHLGEGDFVALVRLLETAFHSGVEAANRHNDIPIMKDYIVIEAGADRIVICTTLSATQALDKTIADHPMSVFKLVKSGSPCTHCDGRKHYYYEIVSK